MKPEEIIKKMMEFRMGKEEPVPAGYYTAEQLAKTAGLSYKTMNARCLELVKTGDLKRIRLRRLRADGSMAKINFYGG